MRKKVLLAKCKFENDYIEIHQDNDNLSVVLTGSGKDEGTTKTIECQLKRERKAENLTKDAKSHLDFITEVHIRGCKGCYEDWRDVNERINFAEAIKLITEDEAKAYRHQIGDDPREEE